MVWRCSFFFKSEAEGILIIKAMNLISIKEVNWDAQIESIYCAVVLHSETDWQFYRN